MKEYTVREIAQMLGTNEETVRRWIRDGKLAATCTSRKTGNRVSEEDLQAFLKERNRHSQFIFTPEQYIDQIFEERFAAFLAVQAEDIMVQKVEDLPDGREMKRRLDEQTAQIQERIAAIQALVENYQKQIELYQLQLQILEGSRNIIDIYNKRSDNYARHDRSTEPAE